MKKPGSWKKRVGFGVCIVIVGLLPVLLLASCGGSSTGSSTKSTSAKLPPGVTQSEPSSATSPTSSSSATQGSATQSTDSSSSQSQTSGSTGQQSTAKTPSLSAVLGGTKFTVVSASRPTTNQSVVSSSGRAVDGDYLEIELTAQNVATDYLTDLSEYSFRLYGPGINADSYYSYYGDTGTYGKYVDEHEISASLLAYSDLQAVAYKLKVGETVDKVFTFFDLNPDNVGKNPNVTKDNTSLVIYKTGGLDSDTQVSIPLAGYPD